MFLAVPWVDQLNEADWTAFEHLRREYLDKPKQFPTTVGRWTALKIAWSGYGFFREHQHLFTQIWTRFGLTDTGGFKNWLDNAVRQKLGNGPILFRNLKIPLKVVAGDLLQGKMQVFGTSAHADLNPVEAAIASAAYPLFFQPYAFQGSLFVDGGLLSNLPAWVFDDERLRQERPIATFGFRFAEVPLVGPPTPTNQPPSSFPEFFKRLAITSIFGGQELGARAIDEYYSFTSRVDIDTLAFHEIAEKAAALVEAGRKGVAEFFDTQIGPRDPDEMAVLLGVVANFTMQALDRLAPQNMPIAALMIDCPVRCPSPIAAAGN